MKVAVSNRLKEHRERMGLSQSAVGRHLDLSEATVNRHECGARRPDQNTLKKYAVLYGVEAIDLFLDHNGVAEQLVGA